MRTWLSAAVAMLVLGTSLPAFAQKDKMQIGETLGATVLRPNKAPESFNTTPDPAQKDPKAILPEQAPARLSPEVAAALSFLVRWGRGQMTTPAASVDPATPVVVGNQNFSVKDVQLVLPFNGLSAVREGDAVQVKVAELGVKTPVGEKRGPAVLHVQSKGPGRAAVVTKVTVN